MKYNNNEIGEGYISIWLGNFETERHFKEYIKNHYEIEDDTASNVDLSWMGIY